ncbi:hypothetical protein K1T71_008361 [Dendrolimus kikuchii]|uniref:Uncharacterized protein n=1 Tax=Dendrolimus kikuchii TaxID=765133 RepID=A0ACC1CY20_9NEOP|nr:hypothetical protein K1T71_008361 [Dendrolimus kikuchii]
MRCCSLKGDWNLVITAFAALAHCSEYDDLDQKKRGFTKGSSSNTISTGAQKQDYTYSIYSQNPSSQNSQPVSSSYQSQVPNSFYPNQASSQYYSSSGTETPQTYTAQPPANHIPSQPSQFTPISFVPNPGYQAKYQVVPSKQGLQVAIVQPPYSFQTPQVLHYPQSVFSSNPSSAINQLGVSPFQHLLGNSYLGHPSSMLLFAQPHQLYNNLAHPSPPSLYYPSNNQAKYNVQLSSPVQSAYDTVQSQTIPKEENENSVVFNNTSADTRDHLPTGWLAERIRPPMNCNKKISYGSACMAS